jgi:hypothetical protein
VAERNVRGIVTCPLKCSQTPSEHATTQCHHVV